MLLFYGLINELSLFEETGQKISQYSPCFSYIQGDVGKANREELIEVL